MSVAATQKKTRQRRSFSEICITHRADNTATCWHSISSVLRVSDLTTDIHHDTFCNQRFEMARLYFLKIMSSNNKKTILDEKKCVGRKKWENGRNNDTQLVLVLAFHLYHHPRHNSQHHYGSGRPAAHSPAQNFLLGPTLGNSQPLPRTTHLPTTCVQWSNLPTSFFLPTPEKTECSSAFLLEHCSGPKCPFQKTLSPQSFTWKTGVLHISWTATQPNTIALGNWFSWHLWRSSKYLRDFCLVLAQHLFFQTFKKNSAEVFVHHRHLQPDHPQFDCWNVL